MGSMDCHASVEPWAGSDLRTCPCVVVIWMVGELVVSLQAASDSDVMSVRRRPWYAAVRAMAEAPPDEVARSAPVPCGVPVMVGKSSVPDPLSNVNGDGS